MKAPLSKVIDAMRKVEEGDLNSRVDITSRDESARVVQTFNFSMKILLKHF